MMRAAATALAIALAPVAALLEPEAEIVGKDVISMSLDEFGGAISPDGTSIYFDRSVPAHYAYMLWVSHSVSGVWGAPELMPFSGRYRDSDPVLSPDGNTLLFLSDRPIGGVDRHAFSIWAAHMTSHGWAEPRPLDGPVNSEGSQVFASMAANGNVYFSSSRGGGRMQVYRSRLVAGVYQPTENLGPAINPEGAYTADVFVAPDQSYVLLGIYGARVEYVAIVRSTSMRQSTGCSAGDAPYT